MSTSPADRANLAPLDVRPNGAWLAYLNDLFMVKHTYRLDQVRGNQGPNASGGLRVDRILIDQRHGATLAKYNQGARGHMNPLPTSQDLIAQITGIGAIGRGR